MKVESRLIDDVAVISLSGRLMGGPDTSDDVKSEIYKYLDKGIKKVVIDLEAVSRMNSSGLGILISALTSVRSKGGELRLAALNENMEGILVMTKLNTIFDIHETAEGAAKSF